MSRLRIGVAGLGRAFTLMVPTFRQHPRVQLVAAADPRAEARERFARDFGAPTYGSIEELCADRGVQAVYVATPHQDHAAHAIAAIRAGKHVLVEKPMAIALEEAQSMVDAARAAGVHLIVGHSHSFDAPIARAHAIVASGELGRVRMITRSTSPISSTACAAPRSWTPRAAAGWSSARRRTTWTSCGCWGAGS